VQDDIIAILQQEIEQSYNAELDQVQAAALLYYDAVPGVVPAGWSDLVSPDVRDAIESTIAEIMGAINPNEPLATFDPESEADIETSDLETKACHHVIFGVNRGYILLESAIRDCLLQRYGVIKVNSYQGRIYLTSVAPENFRWSNDLQSPFIDEARFIAEKLYYTRAELRDMGCSNVDDASAAVDLSSTQMARQEFNDIGGAEAARTEDDLIQCWECYLIDNKTGGRKCYLINENVMLRQWSVAFLPYATGVAILRPHRFDGMSLYDRLAPIQNTKTFLLRQLATNARLASQNRLAIRDRGVNPDDLLSEELNPIIRCTGLPGEALLPLPVQDVTSQLLATLQWMDGIRRDDGGASIDMNSPEMAVANQSAHAAEREYSFRELQASSILRTLGETLVRSLYLVVHATMRQVMTYTRIKSDNTYIAANPTQFPHRTGLIVDIGATMGTKLRRQNAIAQIVQQQQVVLQGGGAGMLVKLPDLYAAQMMYAKLAGIPNPEQYWTDPNSPEAVQMAQQQAAQQAEQAQKAEQMQMEMLQQPVQIQHMKNETDIILQHLEAQEEEKKLKQKYFETVVKNQADERALDIKELETLMGIANAGMAEDEVGEDRV
jgi:hypothetical protein